MSQELQVDQVKALGLSYRPKLVIVSLGGNDLSFSTVGQTCLAQATVMQGLVRR